MDTSEEAKLHSRLEQQSNLICMLKQRLDNTLRYCGVGNCRFPTGGISLFLFTEID